MTPQRSNGARLSERQAVSEVARARSRLYGLLADLVSFPTDDLARACREGQLRDTVREAAASLPYELSSAPITGLADPGAQYLALQGDYIGLFDLPGGGRAVPLYAGVVSPSRHDSMEELLRFYRHFGLTVSEEIRDLPDAIPTVLEFLHFLSFREIEPQGSEDVRSVRTAQGDVLERHLLPWTVAATRRIVRGESPAFYGAVITVLGEFVAREVVFLGRVPGHL